MSPDGWAFFLDVDGTLIDLAETPDGVVVPPDLPAMLDRLAERAGGAVAIVSGRAIAALDRLLAPAHLAAAGAHGAELRLAGGAVETVAGPALDGVRTRLAALAARHPKLLVEDKGVAIAVHYRADPQLGPVIGSALDEIVASHDGLHVQPGKMVFEVRPAGVDKGRAVATLMQTAPFAGRRPLAIGDDLTDETMLAAARRLGGMGVWVGATMPPGGADARLDGPESVRRWLRKLAGDAI